MFDVCILFGHQSLWKDYFFFTHKLITCISYLRWATNHWFTQSGEYKLMFITKTPDAMIYLNNELFHFFWEHAIYYTNLNQPKIRKKQNQNRTDENVPWFSVIPLSHDSINVYCIAINQRILPNSVHVHYSEKTWCDQ